MKNIDSFSIKKYLNYQSKNADKKSYEKYILISFVFTGILYWFLEALIHAYILKNDDIIKQLFKPTLHEFWMRISVILLIIILGFYIKRIFKIKIENEKKINAYYTLLNNILEAWNYPIYIIDPSDYKIILANNKTLRNIKGNKITCYELTHGRKSPCSGLDHICPLDKVKKSKTIEMVEHTHYDKNNKVSNILIYGCPILNDKNEVVLFVEYCMDVTKSRMLEKKLIKTQNEKLQLLSQISFGISHEFNNILEIIKLKTGLGFNNLKNTNKIKKILDSIDKQTDRGASIINRIKEFAKPAPLNLVEKDIGKLIVNSFKLVEELLQKENIRFTIKYKKKILINVDPFKFQQVMQNLINNSRHAIKPKGSGMIKVMIKDIKNNIEINFTDNGEGIDKKDIKYIFNPFFTLKGSIGKDQHNITGTGLGLTISRSIIKQHQGNITVKSKKGSMTLIKIKLLKNREKT